MKPEEVGERLLDLASELLDRNRDDQAPKIAALFCAMSDDGQAQFFEHVAKIMRGWGTMQAATQRSYIAGHMRTCECVTDAGREFVTDIAAQVATA